MNGSTTTSSTEDEETKTRQNAFAVYCEYVKDRMLVKTSKLQEENNVMSKARDVFTSLKVRLPCATTQTDDNEDDANEESLSPTSFLHELDLLNFISETTDGKGTGYLYYELDTADGFPLEKLNDVAITLTGTFLPCMAVFSVRPSLWFDGDDDTTVHMSLSDNYGFRFQILATVTDFSSTREEVQTFIDTNQYSMVFMDLGAVHVVEDGEVDGDTDISDFFPNPLRGATVTVTGISIKKDVVQPLLDINVCPGKTKRSTDDDVEDALRLSNCSGKWQKELRSVALELQKLEDLNVMLQSYMGIISNICIRGIDSQQLSVDLKTGKTFDYPGGRMKYWKMHSDREPKSMIPFSIAIRETYLQFGLMKIGNFRQGSLGVDEEGKWNGCIYMEYGESFFGHDKSIAIFRGHFSSNTLDSDALPGSDLLDYVHATLTTGRLVINDVPYEMPDPQPDFSITFCALCVPLHIVDLYLKSLGIDSSSIKEY